jgi:hypothetical protein
MTLTLEFKRAAEVGNAGRKPGGRLKARPYKTRRNFSERKTSRGQILG